MSRKYRQVGYQDSSGSEQRDKGRSQGSRPHREGPRSPRMPGFQVVSRCSACGTTIHTELEDITFGSQCGNCGADLRCCKNCVYFDPSSRFECTEPVKARVSPKDKRNDCEFFELKTTVEKAVSSRKSRPDDPRSAFDSLFKK